MTSPFFVVQPVSTFYCRFQIMTVHHTLLVSIFHQKNNDKKMKNRAFTFAFTLFLFFSFTSFSCITDRNLGPVEKETRKVGDFTEIEVSHGINVYITMGNDNHLEVETNEDLMDKLVTEIRGDKLKIYFEGSFIWTKTANVYLDARTVHKISASGGSDVKGENELKTENLELRASGGSDIRLEIDVRNLEVDISGGSDVDLIGEANYIEANASGGSDLKAFDLITQTARLEASGGSDIKIFVEDELEARASSGSDIKYKGNPRNLDTRDSSGGDVSRSN